MDNDYILTSAQDSASYEMREKLGLPVALNVDTVEHCKMALHHSLFSGPYSLKVSRTVCRSSDAIEAI